MTLLCVVVVSIARDDYWSVALLNRLPSLVGFWCCCCLLYQRAWWCLVHPSFWQAAIGGGAVVPLCAWWLIVGLSLFWAGCHNYCDWLCLLLYQIIAHDWWMIGPLFVLALFCGHGQAFIFSLRCAYYLVLMLVYRLCGNCLLACSAPVCGIPLLPAGIKHLLRKLCHENNGIIQSFGGVFSCFSCICGVERGGGSLLTVNTIYYVHLFSAKTHHARGHRALTTVGRSQRSSS